MISKPEVQLSFYKHCITKEKLLHVVEVVELMCY